MANFGAQRNKDFVDDLMDATPLDKAVGWIHDTMEVNDIFEEKEIFDWVSRHCEPEDVFTDQQLQAWAEKHYNCPKEHVE
jgi:hypothetical protein